jgi:hypothetical protein
MAAISQVRQSSSQGRAYFERKVAEGKTKKEAVRALKRQVSNAVYRQLVLDVERVREDTRKRLIAWHATTGRLRAGCWDDLRCSRRLQEARA